MRIRKLQLKNGFKRFYDLTIDLGENPKKIIALVGPNGCGKSSILESMIFHQKQYGARIGNSGDQNNQYYSMKNELVFRFDNVIIDFVEGSFAQIMNIKKENLKKQTIFSYRSPYRYNSHVKVKQSTSLTEIHMNDYGASSAVAIDSKMEINYRRLYVKYFNYLHDTDCKPSEAKQKIIGDLNSSFKNCLDIEIVSIGSIDESKGTLYFTKKDQTTEFEFNVLSSGEKEVVDMLLDLYLRQDEYNDSIYIIDEPELHINTSIQRKLLIEINNLISDNCQIWIATHSIGFLRAIQEDFKNESQIIQFKTGI
ncbi:MAG: AAA family ATPase, partial [Candidatus Delongbacteria bacterium]|nr:AAA family ATPase [Candidatus Delongbacteria bacterium]